MSIGEVRARAIKEGFERIQEQMLIDRHLYISIQSKDTTNTGAHSISRWTKHVDENDP